MLGCEKTEPTVLWFTAPWRGQQFNLISQKANLIIALIPK